MLAFKCKKHNELMLEKLENEEIVPYCLSCYVDRKYNEDLQRYNENKDENERKRKQWKRKYFFMELLGDTLKCVFGSLFFICLFGGYLIPKISICITILITLIYTISRGRSGEYSIGNNYHAEPTLERTREWLKNEIERNTSQVKLYKQKLQKEYRDKSVGMDNIDTMKGYSFEEYIAGLLKNLGYQEAKVTPKTGDGGVDIVAKDQSGIKVAVQCKRLGSKVGNNAIQEVYLGKKLENCKRAIVITNSYFTKPAIEAALIAQVELWDRDRLIEEMRKVELKIIWEDFLRQRYAKPFCNGDKSYKNVLAK